MAFKLENFGSEVANIKNIFGGVCYYRYWNEDSDDLTTPGVLPNTLGLKVGDRINVIPAVPETGVDTQYFVAAITDAGVVELATGEI